MKRFGLVFWVVMASVGGTACSGDSPSGDGSGGGNGDGGQNAGGGGAGSGGAGGEEPADRVLCEQYLECLSQVSPSELAVALDAYGDGGSCWSTQTEELCTQACLTGMAQHHATAPEACIECVDDADCDSSRCDAGSCLACSSEYVCAGGDCSCGGDAGGLACCDPDDPACTDSPDRCDLACEVCT